MAQTGHHTTSPAPRMPSHTTVAVHSDFGSYDLAAPEDDHIASVVRRTGRPYEERLLRLLVHLTRSLGGTVVDVGANIGNHTIFFARRGSPVIAVEANPDALLYLKKNVEAYEDLVRVWPVAAGAVSGRGRIAEDVSGQLGQTKLESDPEGHIEVVTLDSIYEAVSILKVDVEGGEESVLKGALQLIHRSRPVIVVESWDAHHRKAIVRLLRPLGYHRFPLSLCSTPTYVYVPSWRLLVRAWTMARVPAWIFSSSVDGVRKFRQRVLLKQSRQIRRSPASAQAPLWPSEPSPHRH